jgi:nucleoside-triphosphatase THEP1
MMQTRKKHPALQPNHVLRKNIFLTGAPSSGKTTVIKKLIGRLDCPARGFYTEEEHEVDRRTGFMMKSLDGNRE